MQANLNGALEDHRAIQLIGRIKAVGRWRSAEEPATEADRRRLLFVLVREAQDYRADVVVDVRFEAEETAESCGVGRHRLVAAGAALRALLAA